MTPGTRIGAYEIVTAIGSGGMGEVYRARDTRLEREVALKILPDTFASDADRLLRFEREAKTLAALNHPHIAQIYGLEESVGGRDLSPAGAAGNRDASAPFAALVMELVDGEDLAQRIARGPIPLDDALPMARQIAEALEAAHDAGIIHRDLKPANVKVRPDGTVKVLDFGLAKAIEHGSRDSDRGPIAATITSPAMTVHGMILGTAAYMAPEQTKGKPVDRRADIWAFGCVLYEMLTGRRAFAGEDITDTIVAIASKDPDWSQLPASTPASVSTLMRRCLEKSVTKRLPHIGSARLDLDDSPAPAATAPAQVQVRGSRIRMVAGVAAALVLGVAADRWWQSRQMPVAQTSIYRASLLIPPDTSFAINPPTARFAVSPDGRQLAYAAVQGTTQQLWLRSLTSLTARAVARTENAAAPFWSPDSRYVAYVADGQLLKVDAASGAPAVITENASLRRGPQPGSWNADEVIIIGNNATISRVSARGGALESLTTLDAANGESWHGFPWFLPDGRHFLYTAYKGLTPLAVYVAALDNPSGRIRLMEGGSNVQYAGSALLYLRGTTLVAQPFDPVRRVLGDEPTPIADALMPNIALPFGGSFSVSQTGTLVLHSLGKELGLNDTRSDNLVWRTRAGTTQPLGAEPGMYRFLSIAPEGRRAVVSSLDQRGRSDLWIIDLSRGVRSRFTFDGRENAAVWLPNGRGVVFNSAKDGGLTLYRKNADAGGEEQVVLADDGSKTPLSVSPDGKLVLYDRLSAETGYDIWMLPLDGSAKASGFVSTPFNERWAQFSPDGRWVAYMSDESGTRQIYIRAFPSGAQQLRVSPEGGDNPRWSRDGRELFFYYNGKMMAAAVQGNEHSLEITSVTPLFDCRPPEGFSRPFYDVTPDGRFLMMASEGSPGQRR